MPMFGLEFRVCISLAIAGALGLAGLFIFYKGKEVQRDEYLLAELQKTVKVANEQKTGTVTAVINYSKGKVYDSQRVARVLPSIIDSCTIGRLLSAGFQVRADSTSERMSIHATGPAGRNSSEAYSAARSWCTKLGQSVEAGVENTRKLKLCSDWIDANGGLKQ